MVTTGKVYLIGAGPGQADLLTLRALRVLGTADVVVYDRLVSPEVLEFVPARARRVPVGKAPKCHSVSQGRINDLLAGHARAGLTVARLKGGDPLIFGRGSEEAAYLAQRGISFEYVPGVTAAQGIAAVTGVPLTHRGLATGVRYVTGHRAADRALDLDWDSLADINTTLVIYMGLANMAGIARRLMGAGLPASLPVLAVSEATTPRERHLLSRLDRIGAEAQAAGLTAPTLFIVGRVVSLYRAPPGDIRSFHEAPRETAVWAGE